MVDLYIFNKKVDLLNFNEEFKNKEWCKLEDLEEGYTMTFRIDLSNNNNNKLWQDTEVKEKEQDVRQKLKN